LPDAPDFEALRAERDAAVAKIVKEAARSLWGDEAAERITFHASFGGGTASCYCACPDGPCEHQFDGWREFDDGLGGEQFCQRCGMGAMSHSMHTSWE
jgi:hypothetical protein